MKQRSKRERSNRRQLLASPVGWVEQSQQSEPKLRSWASLCCLTTARSASGSNAPEIFESPVEDVARQPTVPLDHAENLDLFLADQIDRAIPALDHLAHVLALELGHDTPGEGQRDGLLGQRSQDPRSPKRGRGLVERDVVRDLLEIGDGAVGPDQRSRRHLSEPA